MKCDFGKILIDVSIDVFDLYWIKVSWISADKAYRDMRAYKQSQSVIVSGV